MDRDSNTDGPADAAPRENTEPTARRQRSTAPIDAAEVARALKLLVPAGDEVPEVVEVRILDGVVGSDNRQHPVHFGYFDDPAKLIEALQSVRRAKGIYFTPNPVALALLARAENRIRRAGKGDTTSDGDITARCFLLIDCDPVRPAGISSTDAEHDAALARATEIAEQLQAEGWPEPIAADSGNGGHLLFDIDLPTNDDGLVQRCLEALAARFADAAVKVDRKVFNPARIWKLYGTLAAKGDSTTARPHRMARILSAPAPEFRQVVSRKLLEALAATAPAPAAPNPLPVHSGNGHSGGFDLDRFIGQHLPDATGPDPWKGTGRRWVLNQSPLCDHHDGAAFIAQQPSGAIIAGCQHNSCNWNWHDLRERFEPRANRQQTSRHTPTAGSPIGNAEPVSYRLITSAELDAEDYQQEYLVEHTLVAGQPCIVAGSQKTLKTNLIIDLAISLASRQPFLGELRVNRMANVAMMSGESGLATLQETARRICDAKGIQLAGLEPLIWSPDLPNLADPDHEPALEAFLKRGDIEVIVIDPAYLSLPGGDAGNLFIQGAMLRRLAAVCQKNGATMILIHHTKKGVADPFQPPELGDIAWAGFQEFARQWILVGRRERYEPGTGNHRLWLNVGGSAGHSALWALNIAEGVYDGKTPRHWQVSLAKAEEARRDAQERQEASKAEKRKATSRTRIDADKAAIKRAAGKFPLGETKTTLRTHCGMNGDRFNTALGELLGDGEIVATTIVKGNKKRETAYRLKPDQEQPDHPDKAPGQTGPAGGSSSDGTVSLIESRPSDCCPSAETGDEDSKRSCPGATVEDDKDPTPPRHPAG